VEAVSWWCCLVRCGCGVALVPRWQGGAEGPWRCNLGLACCGVVVFSAAAGRRWCFLSSFSYTSLGRGVRRWMRRGPHAEWPGSAVFVCAATRGFCRSFVGVRGSATMSMRLVGDSPWWRGSGGLFSLQRAAALAVAQRWWQQRWLSRLLWLFSQVVVVWCLVGCVVRVCCSCVVALASACDVKLLFLLI
jgi:hypothetical protein